MKKIAVLLADDHQIVREGFRALLANEPDIEVVGEAANGREAVQLTRKLRPDVVVMDIAMPLLNGLEATRQIRKSFPETRVVILSAYNDDAYIERATELGAAGFLLKQSSSQMLAQAIRKIQDGELFFSPAIARPLRGHDQKPSKIKKGNRLSLREAEVLQLIAEGMPNKKMAGELGVSIKTVDKHRQRLMDKLDIHDTASLTRYAMAEGIIENTARAKVS